jgi:arylsulfatase A-like enzyme
MPDPAKNFLFLSIEDLNDWIEPLGGHPDTITPNLTRLAARAKTFTHAYAAAPACSPSRTSTLFGQHPWESGVYGNEHKWHDIYPRSERMSLVGRLRDAGYQTHGAGKVFHVRRDQFDYDDWDSFRFTDFENFDPITKLRATGKFGADTDFGPQPNDSPPQSDDMNTTHIIEQMTADASGQFWALGIYRPHLPFVVPQRFFDMLPNVVSNPPGLGMNDFDIHSQTPHATLSEPGKIVADARMMFRRVLDRQDEYQQFVKAYLASIAYADYLLGRVLDHMDETGLWDSTTVILWSDHGYQLGEKLAFHKFTPWERSLRVPVMIAGPDIETGTIDEPISLVDLAPTIMQLAGKIIPNQFSGQNLTPLLYDEPCELRGYATSIWLNTDKQTKDYRMVLSSRTADHRYIFYWDGSEELYDHRVDPYEHNNLLKDVGEDAPPDLQAIREAFMDRLPFDVAEPTLTAHDL